MSNLWESVKRYWHQLGYYHCLTFYFILTVCSSFQLCLRGLCLYVDGQNKSYNNWMAFMECANFAEEQNLEAYQSYGEIYFKTTKVIEPGSDLKVFYSEEYASHVGFKMKLNELHAVYAKGIITICILRYSVS